MRAPLIFLMVIYSPRTLKMVKKISKINSSHYFKFKYCIYAQTRIHYSLTFLVSMEAKSS